MGVKGSGRGRLECGMEVGKYKVVRDGRLKKKG